LIRLDLYHNLYRWDAGARLPIWGARRWLTDAAFRDSETGTAFAEYSARIPSAATRTSGGDTARHPCRALAPEAPGAGPIDTTAAAERPTGLCPRCRVAAGARRAATKSDRRARSESDQLQASSLRRFLPQARCLPRFDPALSAHSHRAPVRADPGPPGSAATPVPTVGLHRQSGRPQAMSMADLEEAKRSPPCWCGTPRLSNASETNSVGAPPAVPVSIRSSPVRSPPTARA